MFLGTGEPPKLFVCPVIDVFHSCVVESSAPDTETDSADEDQSAGAAEVGLFSLGLGFALRISRLDFELPPVIGLPWLCHDWRFTLGGGGYMMIYAPLMFFW